MLCVDQSRYSNSNTSFNNHPQHVLSSQPRPPYQQNQAQAQNSRSGGPGGSGIQRNGPSPVSSTTSYLSRNGISSAPGHSASGQSRPVGAPVQPRLPLGPNNLNQLPSPTSLANQSSYGGGMGNSLSNAMRGVGPISQPLIRTMPGPGSNGNGMAGRMDSGIFSHGSEFLSTPMFRIVDDQPTGLRIVDDNQSKGDGNGNVPSLDMSLNRPLLIIDDNTGSGGEKFAGIQALNNSSEYTTDYSVGARRHAHVAPSQ